MLSKQSVFLFSVLILFCRNNPTTAVDVRDVSGEIAAHVDVHSCKQQFNASRDDFLSAFGSIPHAGHVTDWIGGWNECVVKIQGQYCNTIWSSNYSSSEVITWGTCFPKACSITQVTQSLDMNDLRLPLEPLKRSASFSLLQVTCMVDGHKLDSNGVACLAFIAIMVTIVLVSSIVHLVQKAETNSIIKCFSLIENIRLLVIKPDNRLSSIDGLKCLLIIIVVVFHTFETYSIVAANMAGFATWLPQIWYGGLSTSALFAMSGYLLSYQLFTGIAQKKIVLNVSTWMYFYVKRYMRLTPLYAVVLWISASLLNHVIAGPFWNDGHTPLINTEHCQEYWWQNLLYLSVWSFEYKKCLLVMWFLDVAMTLYVFSPLVLYPLYRSHLAGSTVGLLVMAGCWTTTFFMTLWINVNWFNPSTPLADLFDYCNYLYYKPYYHGSPWICGILTGYYHQKWETRSRDNTGKTFPASMGWLVCVLCFVVPAWVLVAPNVSLLAFAITSTFGPTLISIGVCWLIFAWSTRQRQTIYFDDVIPEQLSTVINQLIYSFNQLSYCVYLLHVQVTALYLYNLKSVQEYSMRGVVVHNVAAIFCVTAIAAPFSLLFEFPFIQLVRRL